MLTVDETFGYDISQISQNHKGFNLSKKYNVIYSIKLQMHIFGQNWP